MRWPLIQSLTIDGNELDMGLLKQATYVETMDLSGPRLLIRATDEDRLLRDDFGMVEGAVIAAEIDDADMGGSLVVSESFVIKSVDSDANKNLAVECLAEPVDALKRPAEAPIFRTMTNAGDILSEATGLPLEVDDFPLVDAWHLLPGERTSKKLRMLARELGAAVWYARGTLYMRALQNLWGEETVHTFHQDDRSQERLDQIDDFKLIYRRDVVNDRVKRQYGGWHMTKGMLGGGGMHEQTQYERAETLESLNLATVPVIDLLLFGQGQWAPGQRIELKFHRSRKGRPFDESIPSEVMISTIASQQTKGQYRTRIKGVILND